MPNKGLRTKSERTMQIIRLSDPNTYDPNGARTILQSADDHNYKPADSFDSSYRAGANAKSFNAVTGRIRNGDFSGALYYNLFDDQIAPYVYGEFSSDSVSNSIRTRIYSWVQMGRVDRPAFAVEEGAPDRALRGLNGHFNSFKFTSKRDQSGGNARVSVSFTTTKAPSVGMMTGSVAQNTVLTVTGTNVSGDGVFSLAPSGASAANITFTIGETTAQTVAKLAAIGITATVAGTVAISSGETHTLTAGGALGNATVYNTIVVTPGMTALALQTAIRALGGIYAGVTVNGSTTALGGGEVAAGNPVISSTPTIIDLGAAKIVTQVRAGSGGGSASATTIIRASNDGTFATSTLLGSFGGVGGTFNIGSGNQGSYRYLSLATSDPSESYNTANGFFYTTAQTPSTGFYTVAFPNAVGNVTDITATPGTGWSTSVTQAGAALGSIAITVNAPAQTLVSATKISGAGWSVALTQAGSNGKIRSVMKKPLPVLPQHLAFFAATTYAGLDLPGAKIGGVEEAEMDIPKIREPRMPHNETDTYSEVVDVEKPENTLSVLLFADQDSPAKCAELVAYGDEYVSRPLYWRLVATCPESGFKIIWELYGSIGKTTELEYNGNVEERRLMIDVLENLDEEWNFRVTTKVPV